MQRVSNSLQGGTEVARHLRQERQRRLMRLLVAALVLIPVPVFGILVVVGSWDLASYLLFFSLLALFQLIVASAGEMWINRGYLLSAKVMFWASIVFFHAAGATTYSVRKIVSADALLAGAFWCLVGMAAACIPGLFLCVNQKRRIRRTLLSPRAIAIWSAVLLVAGILAFIPFLSWRGWTRYFLTRYTMDFLGTSQGAPILTRFWSTAQLLRSLSAWLVAIGLFEFRWGVFKVLALLVGVFVVVPAIVGERGEFFSVVLMALLIRHKRRPYSNLSVVVTALVVILSFGFIFLWRTQRALMFSQSDYGKLFVSSLVAGNSLRVVGAAAELFPGVYEYSWGRSYYAQLVGKILPVLGWQLVQGMPLQDLEPARWITWVMELRLKPDLWPDEVGMRVAGWGYSMIAEAFQNFGGLGVVIVMALFGGLAALLDRWHVSSGPAGELAASLFIANLLLGVRNSFGNFLNRVVIGLAVVALFWLYCELTTKKEGCGRPISMPKSHAAALTGRKAESV